MESFQLVFQESLFEHLSILKLKFKPVEPKHWIFGTYLQYKAIYHDLQRPHIYHFYLYRDSITEKTIMKIDIEHVMYQNLIKWKMIYEMDLKWKLKECVETKVFVVIGKDGKCQRGPYRQKWKEGWNEWRDAINYDFNFSINE